MRRTRLWQPVLALVVSGLCSGSLWAQSSAVTPVPREDNWMNRHESFNKRAKEGNVDLVFIGDSITQGWEGGGKEAWARAFEARHPANMGFSGDRTQHVLWRLDHGEVDGIKPGIAVVMIGTNNSNGDDHTAPEIAEGITAIVAKLRAKLPDTKVLLLGVFPRGEKPNPQREKLSQVNAAIARLTVNSGDPSPLSMITLASA